jgi:hypothetical protein
MPPPRLFLPAAKTEFTERTMHNLFDHTHPEIVSTNIYSTPVQIKRGVYLKADWKF